MKTSGFVTIAIILVLSVIVYYSLTPNENGEDYKSKILLERQQIDDFMKTAQESPFAKSRTAFMGLKYFEPDLKYRIIAEVEKIENKSVVTISTSTGEENQYLQYAWLAFELDGIKNRLLLLEVMSMGPARGTLFLSFGDETSAHETYGAGRYLDLKKVPGAVTIELDFNKAYNPYCAYSDEFSCPFPPKENILKVAIRAGERSYH